MKGKRTKRFLSLFLALTMVVGLLTVPASAAEEKAADYTWTGDNGATAGSWLEVGSGLITETGKNIPDSSVNTCYKWGGATQFGKNDHSAFSDTISKNAGRYIKLTLDGAATVKVYFDKSKAGSDVPVLYKDGLKTDTTTVNNSGTETASGIAEYTITEAGVYVVTATGTNRVGKIEVFNDAPADVALESLTANPTSVKIAGTSSETVTLTATEGHTDTLKIKTAPDGNVAKAELSADGKTLTITGVAAGDTSVVVSGTTAVNVEATVTIKVEADTRNATQIATDAADALKDYAFDTAPANNDAAKTALETAITEANVVPDGFTCEVAVSNITAPTDGTKESPTGTPGSVTYTITVSKNGDTDTHTTEAKTASITAKAYDPNEKTFDLSAQMKAIKDANISKDKAVLPAGAFWNNSYFKVYIEKEGGHGNIQTRTGKESVDTASYSNQSGIEFTPTSNAKVTLSVSSTGSNNYSLLALGEKDGANLKPASVGSFTQVSAVDATTANTQADANGTMVLIKGSSKGSVTYNVDAGKTYRVYSPHDENHDDASDTANPNSRGFRLYNIAVEETDATKNPEDYILNNAPTYTITPATSEPEVGETVTLVAKVNEDDAIHYPVILSSSDENIATVNKDGKYNSGVITAVSVGEATITATSVIGNVTAAATVNVKAAAKDMTDATEDVTAKFDTNAKTITVVVKDGETEITDATVKYSSVTTAGETTLTYDQTSQPVMKDAGEYTVYYQVTKEGFSDLTGSATVSISKADAPALSLKPDKGSVQSATSGTANSVTLTLTGLPTTDTDATATVTCDDNTITVTDNSNGTYTVSLPDATKDYTFTATYDGDKNHTGATDTCSVHVTAHGTEVAKHSITVTGGTVTDNKTEAPAGEHVIVTAAAPETGKTFKEWTFTGVTLSDEDKVKNPLEFQMPAADVTLTATYDWETYAVTATLTNLTSDVTETTKATYGQDLVVTLTAEGEYTLPADKADITVKVGGTATDNFTYADGKVTVAAAAVTGAVEITAAAGIKTYTLTLPADADGCAITADKTTGLKAGDTVTLTVKPAESYKLMSLTGTPAIKLNESIPGTGMDAEGTLTFAMPSGDTTLSAKWSNAKMYVWESKDESANGVAAGTNGKFKAIFGSNSIYDGSTKTWADGYTSGTRFNTKGAASTTGASVEFSIDAAATVTVWWAENNTNRPAVILDASGSTINAGKVIDKNGSEYTSSTYVANDPYMSTFELKNAGKYYVGFATNGAYLFKIQVAEAAGNEPAPEVTVTMDKTATVKAGETVTLTATVANATDTSVTWSSDKETVATVANGVVTGVAEGTAVITATSVADSTKKATCTVTVTNTDTPTPPTPEEVKVTSVTLSATELELELGTHGEATLTATVVATPDAAENETVTWSSSDPTVATVDANGKVTALKAGTTKITATSDKDDTKSAACNVTVIAGGTTTTGDASLVVGDFEIKDKTISTRKEPVTAEEMAAATNAKGYFGVQGTVNKRWGKSDPNCAVTSFDLAKGEDNGFTITLKAGETATMTAVLSTASSDASKVATPKLTKDGTEVNYEGEPITALPDAGGTAKEVIWKNLTEGTYVLVGVSGATDMRVRSITLNITTTSGGSVSVTGVTLDKTTAEVKVDESVKLTATVAPENATNKKATWSSSDPTVATVDAEGNVKGVKAGTATITVTTVNGGKTATCAVTVTAKQDGGSDTPTPPSSSSGGGDMIPTTIGKDGHKNNKNDKTTTTTTVGAKGEGTTTTKTATDGTVTETTKWKDGSTAVTTTKPDGSATTVITDVSGVKAEATTTAEGETTAEITLPGKVDKAVVSLPAKDVKPGTVAVIVKADGTEEILKTSAPTEKGMDLLVSESVSVKFKDNAKSFSDIANDYWAKDAVDFASAREIFKGTSESTFSPLETVDRGMMATVLYRLSDAVAEGENAFFDVAGDAWYTEAVIWANRSGVVTGYADGTFGPADAVTREQMATMLFRYAKTMGMDTSAKGEMDKFGDVSDVSSWAAEAMTWAVGVGLINGTTETGAEVKLSPAKSTSRAEVAAILQRMVTLMMQ